MNFNMKEAQMNTEGHDAVAYFTKVLRGDGSDVCSEASPDSSASFDDKYEDDFDFDSFTEDEQKRQQVLRSVPFEPGRSTRRKYTDACKNLKIIPLREISKQFGSNRICLRRSIIGPRDIKALSTALLRDVLCRVLDLSGIFMDLKTVQYVCLMLIENNVINELHIGGNNLTGDGIKCLAETVKENGVIRTLNVSGNGLRDSDSVHIAEIINFVFAMSGYDFTAPRELANEGEIAKQGQRTGTCLQRLNISHNELREDAGKIIGDALANNKNLKELDLSWNHIRCRGAIEIAKSLEKNTSLITVKLGWNGFAYGGSLAIGEAMVKNTTLLDLDLSCNRIHPPALLQLLKGVTKNKTLIKLNLSHNPITVPFSGVILASIRDSPKMALTYLDLDGVIVDEQFLKILDELESKRMFEVRYEAALPLNHLNRNKLLKDYDKKDDVFTLDPIEMLYTLKEKMRAVDFFSKLDKEKTNTVSKAELHKLFKESGIPVSAAAVDKAMDFIDFKRDGFIDLEEFLEADRKIKRHSRAKAAKRAAKQATLSQDQENRFSQAYRGASFNETTSKVELSVDKEARAMVDAAMQPDDDQVFTKSRPSPLLRNGLLKPLTPKRRASMSTLYGLDRRSSIGGNTFFDLPFQEYD